MRGKKEMIGQVLYRIGALRIISSARAMVIRHLPILAYHRILNCLDEDLFKFDPELVSARGDQFRWQMNYIKKRFSPIKFQDLVLAIETGAVLPKHPIIITFDDGFDDNYRVAYPILHDLGIPATIFLSTGYIGKNNTFWFDWLVYMICTTSKTELELTGVGHIVLKNGLKERRAICKELLKWAKRIPEVNRRQLIVDVEKQVDMCQPKEGFTESRPLTWEQVKEMAENGIEFGSHTVNHPILANLDEEDLKHELTQSKTTIEHKIGQEVNVLAYPVGGYIAFNKHVQVVAKKSGYKLACSYLPGTNKQNISDHFALRRLHVERYTDEASFAAMICLPEILSC